MKKITVIFMVAFLALASTAFAQDSVQVRQKKQIHSKMNKKMQGQHRIGFVDADGDGYNDNAPDADGDGIPNGMDPDYTGSKMHNGRGGMGFVDADGDGINDNAMDSDGDGIPNGKDPDFVRPQNGSGKNMGKGQGFGGHKDGHKRGGKK